MARVKIAALTTAALFLVAAVTWSALPPRTSPLTVLPPPGAPDNGAAHESSGDPHAAGRVAPERSGGFLSTVFALVVPAATTEPTPASRWTVAEVKPSRSPFTPSSRSPLTLSERSESKGSKKSSVAGRALASSIPGAPVDTDADWYAEAPDDGRASMRAHEANPGRTVYPRSLATSRVPNRNAGGYDWYDNLGARDAGDSENVSEQGTSIDALVRSAGGSRGDRVDASTRTRSMSHAGVGASMRSSAATTGLACPAETTRFRLVKLVPSANAASSDRTVSGANGVARGLPSPHEPEPAIVVASLGPKLPGVGTTAYPGLAAPLAESTPKPVAFCPIGSLEKKNKAERWCARADRGGVSFREGPMAFLYPNGKKRAEGTYVDGVLHGAFVEYATNGKKIAEGSYKDGKKSGPWTFWWDNGKKQSQGPYVADDRSGTWAYFDEKGRKTSQGELRTISNVEKKQGRWTYWHANGTKSQEGAFREGQKDGAWKSFDEKGRQVSTLLWREGESQ